MASDIEATFQHNLQMSQRTIEDSNAIYFLGLTVSKDMTWKTYI